MNIIIRKIDRIKVSIREKLNPYLGKFRLARIKPELRDFTIISNNCWAGHVYRYFNLPYNSPTIGLFIFPGDYIKFIYDLEYYISNEIEMIDTNNSKHCKELFAMGGVN